MQRQHTRWKGWLNKLIIVKSINIKKEDYLFCIWNAVTALPTEANPTFVWTPGTTYKGLLRFSIFQKSRKLLGRFSILTKCVGVNGEGKIRMVFGCFYGFTGFQWLLGVMKTPFNKLRLLTQNNTLQYVLKMHNSAY